jgi:hypothetical protein
MPCGIIRRRRLRLGRKPQLPNFYRTQSRRAGRVRGDRPDLQIESLQFA